MHGSSSATSSHRVMLNYYIWEQLQAGKMVFALRGWRQGEIACTRFVQLHLSSALRTVDMIVPYLELRVVLEVPESRRLDSPFLPSLLADL